MNTKKAELAKLKQQIEQNDISSTMHTEYSSSNKRTRHQISEDEDIEILTTQSKLINQDSSLDLGNDQMDYKTATIPKHHQRYGIQKKI